MVLRAAGPRFAGTPWPEMATVEDAWAGRLSDAKSLFNPRDGSTFTWAGETPFDRVMPKAPKSNAWVGGELVRVPSGSHRAPDIHPMQWWLMGSDARIKARADWEVKHGEILQAQNRRGFPREELVTMPPSTIPASLQNRETAAAAPFSQRSAQSYTPQTAKSTMHPVIRLVTQQLATHPQVQLATQQLATHPPPIFGTIRFGIKKLWRATLRYLKRPLITHQHW